MTLKLFVEETTVLANNVYSRQGSTVGKQ